MTEIIWVGNWVVSLTQVNFLLQVKFSNSIILYLMVDYVRWAFTDIWQCFGSLEHSFSSYERCTLLQVNVHKFSVDVRLRDQVFSFFRKITKQAKLSKNQHFAEVWRIHFIINFMRKFLHKIHKHDERSRRQFHGRS